MDCLSVINIIDVVSNSLTLFVAFTALVYLVLQREHERSVRIIGHAQSLGLFLILICITFLVSTLTYPVVHYLTVLITSFVCSNTLEETPTYLSVVQRLISGCGVGGITVLTFVFCYNRIIPEIDGTLKSYFQSAINSLSEDKYEDGEFQAALSYSNIFISMALEHPQIVSSLIQKVFSLASNTIFDDPEEAIRKSIMELDLLQIKLGFCAAEKRRNWFSTANRNKFETRPNELGKWG